MLRKVRVRLAKLLNIDASLQEVTQDLNRKLDQIKESIGRVELRQLQSSLPANIAAAEFQVYSQFGEDGIIQYLISQVPVRNNFFVEFGVEDYVECNTRFLLVNNHWHGLVIDGSEHNIKHIRSSRLYWNESLTAVCHFINAENIDGLLTANGAKGEIGLLSIDIDGNDYWVWEAIVSVKPAIVVAEYNYRFGPDRAVTVPYDPTFIRSSAHYSCIYFGASLSALTKLGEKKGYALVGCSSKGLNAFFVRRDLLPNTLKALSPKEAFVDGQHRESRDQAGKLIFLSMAEEQQILKALPLVEIK